MTILEKIVRHKKKELIYTKKETPVRILKVCPYFYRKPLSLRRALSDPKNAGIIAEFKRSSPSRGPIHEYAIPGDIAIGYEKSGATGISILTDKRFFKGRKNDLIITRGETSLPVLRKDFIVDEYQIIESKAFGADVILLIAAILDKKEITKFARLAKKLELEILFEIHDASELTKIPEEADMVGVNNRDLKTFEVNIRKSMELAPLIPEHMVKVSESGISKPEIITHLKDYGYSGYLIGETFMKTADPGRTCSDFIKQLSYI